MAHNKEDENDSKVSIFQLGIQISVSKSDFLICFD